MAFFHPFFPLYHMVNYDVQWLLLQKVWNSERDSITSKVLGSESKWPLLQFSPSKSWSEKQRSSNEWVPFLPTRVVCVQVMNLLSINRSAGFEQVYSDLLLGVYIIPFMRSSYIYRMEDDAHRVEGGEIQTSEDVNMLKVFQLNMLKSSM